MAYFFVFQNKTYMEEQSGGFLWAPKMNKDGKTFSHWSLMTSVKKGDVIFNSYNGKMLSVIIAQEDCKEAHKPDSFDTEALWEKDGWMVKAKYIPIEHPLIYKEHMSEILKLQGAKYAPYNSLGRGNTGYLFQVTDELADFFISKLGIANITENQGIEETIFKEIEDEVSLIPEETIREQIVQTRIGQVKFKQRLMRLECKCKLCGLENLSFLRASHSKPWRDSDNYERLDKYNGFLFCPAHDALYDKGYISFDEGGSLLISPLLDEHTQMLMNIDRRMRVTLLSGHQKYVKYHRENIFRENIELNEVGE
ncbi:HNH endonuclease [Paenibacillus illinoisensis]|uniref:HNH endonuclease n=1 Tax=Paenibacillus illinoisensis TaxID=59845 RepID=UPI003D9543BF